MHKLDLIGQKIGRLSVIKCVGKSKHRKYQWLCQCECGKTCIVCGCHLRSGHTTSCGCFHKEVMKNRFGKNNPNYKMGIHFCKLKNRWMIRCRDGSNAYHARVIMRNFLGRELNSEWVVHHENEDSTKDDISNLALFENNNAHIAYHWKELWR